MKKNLFILIPALLLVFFVTSCSKDNAETNPTTATPEGKWTGTGQYGTTPGNPTYVFSLTFKANGTVDVVGNNNTAIDYATGNWEQVQDSIKATYTYTSATAMYTLSGKYSANSNIMVGTIGLGTSTSGIGLFSVTKE